jgi:hypothetical protein
MAEPKTFASLSSSLLARKGAAKPAMRPQGWGQGVNLEDLGWNDMGGVQAQLQPDERPEHVPSPITALTPSPRLQPAEPIAPVPSPVIAQQRVIEQVFTAPAPVEPVVVEQPVAVVLEPVVEAAKPEPVVEAAKSAPAAAVAAPKRARSTAEVVAIADRQRRAPGAKAKAAFTLRLDADRHLKLRLACAVSHRSAQQLVTEALDVFLGSLPELDAMAGHVPASAKRH